MSERIRIRSGTIVVALVILCVLGVLLVRLMVPTNTGPIPWHFQFSEVRAYRMNWDDEYARNGILIGESLNESRQPKEGIVLSDRQMEELRKAIMEGRIDGALTMCHYPHHAFIFYSESGEIVGHFDICFLCSSARGAPAGFAEFADYQSLRSLMASLGIPVTHPDWEK